MAFFAYLLESSNLVKGNALSASSENASFPVDNVDDMPISLPWKSTGVTTEWIEVDLGSAQNVSTVALVNHNLTSGATLTIKGGTTPNPTDFSTTITWRERTAWKIFASQSFRYWRLELADSSNPDGVLRAGLWMLGVRTQFAFGFERGWRKLRLARNRTAVTEFGVPIVGLTLDDRTAIELDWHTLDNTNRNTLESFLTALRGNKFPLLFIPDTDLADAYFGRMASEQTGYGQDIGFASFEAVRFEEDAPGTAINA